MNNEISLGSIDLNSLTTKCKACEGRGFLKVSSEEAKSHPDVQGWVRNRAARLGVDLASHTIRIDGTQVWAVPKDDAPEVEINFG